MAQNQNMVRVTNNRPTFLTTPSVGKPGSKGYFPSKRLVPGGNNLPADMVKALDSLPQDGGAGKVWAQWKALQFIRVSRDPADVRKPEGPSAPLDLADRKLEAAEAMVAVEDDPDTLRAWFSRDRREEVRAAILARLTQLGQELVPSSGGKVKG